MWFLRNICLSAGLMLALGANATAQERDVDGWMESSHFIPGVYNVEDLVPIPGTRWIIGGGLTTLGPGMDDPVITKNYIHVFDAETETGSRVLSQDIAIEANPKLYPDTTTPPDWDALSPHGIALGERKGDNITFYATNHGAREAIEVFDIDVSGERPRFTWTGTVPAPEDGFVDAVAWIPGTDGFVVTSLLDPRDPHGAFELQMKGEPTGWVREWHPKSGWKTLPGTENFSTPNGIIVSEDGRHVFVAASTNFSIFRVTRGGTDPEVVCAPLTGVPDNLRWSADGSSILVGIHTEDPETFAAKQMEAAQSGAAMFTTFNITRIDPESMETEIVMPSGLYGALGGATGAIEVGNRLWVSSCKSDRIGIFDLEP